MTTQDAVNPKELERLYKKYFNTNGYSEEADESSLLQPSPLEYVESFTTYGITEEMLIDEGDKNAKLE